MRTLVFLAAGTLIIAQPKGKQTSVICDRTCLEAFVDPYLDALIAHDPKRLTFARDLKFTENGQRLEIGDGLWHTMTGKGAFRVLVTDVDAQQDGFFGSLEEDGS